MEEHNSEFLRYKDCPDCGRPRCAVYTDGHSWCFHCEEFHPGADGPLSPAASRQHPGGTFSRKEISITPSPLTPQTDVFSPIPERGLTKSTVEKFLIDVIQDENSPALHRYPYFKNGTHVANKVRLRGEKDFRWEGDPRGTALFGQQAFPPGSAQTITVVEGELDAPSVFQLSGSKYPVVSVPSASDAVRAVKTNFEYLDSFSEIVVNFDNDEPGQKAARKVAELFRPGKVRTLALSRGKDASEYLLKKIPPAEFVSEWWKGPTFRPDGIKAGSTLWEELINPPSYFTVPYPWEGLNKATYGIRLSELNLFMAETGVGKTSVFKAIAHSLLVDPEVVKAGYGVGFLHLEEPNYDTALGLLSIHNAKPYHLPDTPRTEEELRKAYDELLNNERVLFYDHFGSNDIDEIVSKVRYMAVMGCKYIFLDHLSIIVSDQTGDERKQLDEISTKLKTLTMELNIALFCVIHTNRNGEARGSAGPEKVANNHFSLHRDKKDINAWRRNVTRVEIEKCRLTGRSGPWLWLWYNEETGLLEELDQEDADIYEDGSSPLFDTNGKVGF